MRQYAKNSPQAAARIVALTLVADGDLGVKEYAVLDAMSVHEQLGLDRDALHAVVDTFFADLLSSKQLAWADICPVDDHTLAALMDEIDSPSLRRKVLGICNRLVEADGHVAEGESIVLAAALEHWSMLHQIHKLPDAVHMA